MSAIAGVDRVVSSACPRRDDARPPRPRRTGPTHRHPDLPDAPPQRVRVGVGGFRLFASLRHRPTPSVPPVAEAMHAETTPRTPTRLTRSATSRGSSRSWASSSRGSLRHNLSSTRQLPITRCTARTPPVLRPNVSRCCQGSAHREPSRIAAGMRSSSGTRRRSMRHRFIAFRAMPDSTDVTFDRADATAAGVRGLFAQWRDDSTRYDDPAAPGDNPRHRTSDRPHPRRHHRPFTPFSTVGCRFADLHVIHSQFPRRKYHVPRIGSRPGNRPREATAGSAGERREASSPRRVTVEGWFNYASLRERRFGNDLPPWQQPATAIP